MNIDPDQKAALDILRSGKNTFLTGSAGTGKSTVTTMFVRSCLNRIDVAATTGIAAINLRDQFAAKTGKVLNVMTIYRWAGIGLGPRPNQTHEQFWGWWKSDITRHKLGVIERIRRAETLVIDEISMLPGRILDYLDFHLRRIRKNEEPFGGIQLVATGDFLQLPPVNKSNSGYDWAFLSPAWERGGIVPAVLTTVHRQDEREFVGLLNAFRIGEFPAISMNVLAKRVAVFPDSKIPRLFTHNAAVDKWNNAQLAGIDTPAVEYTAGLSGPDHQQAWLSKNMVTPERLRLKRNARAMVTANISIAGELVASNGTLGTIERFEMGNDGIEWPVFVPDDGKIELVLKRHMWSYDAQDAESATFAQVPLRLAWATTIHKAQGLTLPSAYIDIRAAREPGQAYVAVSRVKTLSGLHLKAVPGGIYICKSAIAFQREAECKKLHSTNNNATP